MQVDKTLRFYRGHSMAGTLRSSDCLWVKNVHFTDLKVGDVIVFSCPNKINQPIQLLPEAEQDLPNINQCLDTRFPANEMVHRVIAIRPKGLVTRGDHLLYPDSFLVPEENIIGRVTHAERSGRTRTVHGGWIGHLRSLILHVWLVIKRFLLLIGRKYYRLLRTSGLVSRFWHPPITKVHLTNGGEQFVKFIFRGRTVATWFPQTNHFECQKPYDLVIRIEEQPVP